jgi:choline dehydrogenase-like flavoprotein
MVQLNQAVWGQVEPEVRSYKGPPSLAISEHWNYEDKGKDYHGGWCYMSQGPLPVTWAKELAGGRRLWGQALVDEMNRYIHSVGLKMVGEVLPDERNTVTLTDERDKFGLRLPRVTFSLRENEKAMIGHALKFMDASLEATGARERWREEDDTCHLNGTARMGDDPSSSVVNGDCRSWDIPNLWVCDGSVFPTVGGVNPSLTIQAIACRTADRIREIAARGEL